MSGVAKRYAEVPWIDWIEWQSVYRGLFHEADTRESHTDDTDQHLEAQQLALSRIAAWRSRVQLPVAVDATAQIVELQLHEHMAQQHHHAIGVASRSYMELSLQYASVIVRCVNGLVDSSQKGAYAMAVSGLAQRIGIPLWIVDLRHESTHNQLPSLPVLRFAAQHLLAWLRSNYWIPQDQVLRSQVVEIYERLHGRWQQEENKQWIDGIENNQIKQVLIPLLVFGQQYGESIAPDGLLFTWAGENENTTDWLTYPKERWISMILEMQSAWRSTSAHLLGQLCDKVLQQSIGGTQDSFCRWWIKLLVDNEWREKLKFAAEPIELLYQSGADMLCRSLEALEGAESDRKPAIETLTSTLRSCRGIRNHPSVETYRQLQRELSTANTTTWTKLSTGLSAPLGHGGPFHSIVFTGFLEHDSACDENDGVFTHALELEETDDETMSMDANYEAELQQTLSLQEQRRQEIIQEGKSVHRTLLPQQEVVRIQNQIEIW